jgi:hypothetical protein
MRLKKLFSHNNKRQIWRLLISETDKLVIEERDTKTKEVFFNCYDFPKAKKILKNYQYKEKNWIGIEAVYNDIIFFHLYVKPEMPGHIGIIAFDLNTKKVLWKNKDLIFHFIYEDKIYCYKESFEERTFFILDYLTGKIIDDQTVDYLNINNLREKAVEDQNEKSGYIFTQSAFTFEDQKLSRIIDKLTHNINLIGRYDYIVYNSSFFLSFHSLNPDKTMNNNFFIIDINSEKTIFAEVIGERNKNFVVDSFFLKNGFLFLLKNKNEVRVFRLN